MTDNNTQKNIFGLKDDDIGTSINLDYYLTNIVFNNTNILDHKLQNQLRNKTNFSQFIEFYRSYKLLDTSSTTYNLKSYKNYLVNFSYILFITKLNYTELFTFDDVGLLIEYITFIYDNIYDKYQESFLKNLEQGLIKIDDSCYTIKVLDALLDLEFFSSYLIKDIDTVNPIILEKDRLIGKLLNMNSTNIESIKLKMGGGTNIDIKKYIERDKEISTLIYNKLFAKLNTQVLYKLFYNIVETNANKSLITVEFYYTDEKNSYRFIMNCFNIAYKFYEVFNKQSSCLPDINYIYSNTYVLSNKSIVPFKKDYRETVDPETILYTDATRWFFLLYGFYKILFYSLILQNCNCVYQLAQYNNITNYTSLFKSYIGYNNIYLENDYARTNIFLFMYEFVETTTGGIDLQLLNEDLIYEILYFYDNYVEYSKKFVLTVKDYVPLAFLKTIIKDPDNIIGNPYLKLKAFKVLYHYNKNIECIDVGENLLNSLERIFITIDRIKDIDYSSDRIIYQTNVLKFLLDKGYMSSNKEFYIKMFKLAKDIVDNKVADVKRIILSSESDIATLKILDVIFEKYLECNIKILVEYLIKSVEINEQTRLYSDENIDLVYHLVKFIYYLFKLFFDKDSSIIRVHYDPNDTGRSFMKTLNKYTFDILHSSNCIKSVIELPNVVFIINRFYPDILEYIQMYDKDYTDNLEEIIIAKNENILDEFPDNMPDEFLDPLLFTPIRDPIILPSSSIVMDKTIIMAHLIENQYDPFNRQQLTMEELIKHNSYENIKKIVGEFVEKRDKWIKDNSG